MYDVYRTRNKNKNECRIWRNDKMVRRGKKLFRWRMKKEGNAIHAYILFLTKKKNQTLWVGPANVRCKPLCVCLCACVFRRKPDLNKHSVRPLHAFDFSVSASFFHPWPDSKFRQRRMKEMWIDSWRGSLTQCTITVDQSLRSCVFLFSTKWVKDANVTHFAVRKDCCLIFDAPISERNAFLFCPTQFKVQFNSHYSFTGEKGEIY